MTTRQHKDITARLVTLLTALLLTLAVSNEAWAYKVTYHILTLPIDNATYSMKSEINGKRLEAIRVIVDNTTTVGLPDHFKSPLVTPGSFKYWTSASFTKTAKQSLYAAGGKARYSDYYTAAGSQTELTEGSAVDSDCEIYVTYTYNASNTIAKLDGTTKYNIPIAGGFLAYNRGRNNRVAAIPKNYVSAEQLISEDFVSVNLSGYGATTYYSGNNSWTTEAEIGSQYHFQFYLVGSDPYNIIVRTAINSGTKAFVEDKKYKYYRDGTLFAKGNDNFFLSSDDHQEYTSTWTTKGENPPSPLASTAKAGYFHNLDNPIWGTFAILNNTNNNGYVFAATRTVNANGAMSDPSKSGSNYQYYYLRIQDKNTVNIKVETPQVATSKFSTDQQFYEIKDVYFNVKTPFGNTVKDSVKMSEYTLQSALIDAKDIPDELRRKYCNFTKFYSDAALTTEITKYSEAKANGYNIYVDYEVSDAIPFKAINPADSYTTATWYELTDEGSVQESGRKIKNNSGTYKNNGANGEYVKESEFAFEGDPYELKVLYRKGTEDAGSKSYVTLSTYAAWDIPHDDVSGSFLLRKYNDVGHWNWDTGQLSQAVGYATKSHACNVGKDAQTITFNVSGLTGSKYYKITTGGTGADQILSVSPNADFVYEEEGTTATITVSLAANTSDAAKTMTITIQEFNDEAGNTAAESPAAPSVITITQGTTSSFTGNAVEYSTTSSTRVKVLELPKMTYTYHIVDKSGRIAVKASASQTIFSTLTKASIPSIIVSPFILDETVTFYPTFDSGSGAGTGTSRTHLSGTITETPDAAADIYVKYTTASLGNKPIKLSENQEFFVKLNGRYLYYDSETYAIKTNSERASDNSYKWKLRNLDPYNMLIDNLGARTAKSVTGDETVTVYDDAGTADHEATRQRGAWVDIATLANNAALTFTTTRDDAQQFIAKSSLQGGIYEVMVATGADVDASTTYYNIGCPEDNTVKVYSNATAAGGYIHGSDVLKFELETESEYNYHLIDKSNKVLLETPSKNPDLIFPAEYQSPLVATYHYYDISQFTVSSGVYTLNGGATELTDISSLDATVEGEPTSSAVDAYDGADTDHKHTDASTTEDIKIKAKKLEKAGTHYYRLGDEGSYTYYSISVTKPYYTDIYVTYDKNDLVTFNSNQSPYLLKFLNPFVGGYRLEDGNDRLTSGQIQAVYPYTNGDGNLNIYGQAMNDEQMEGGASTRPRWVWFFESDNNDPYHVKIHSKSTISFNSVNHPTYLQTYAVHFNQETNEKKQRIVTGGVLPGVSSVSPSEYMVLGTEGNYRLMTTYAVPADLNGDDDTEDAGENQRQVVNAFEQYWKTYNMIKLHLLGIDKSTNDYNTDESTWVVPEAQRAALKAKLATYQHTATDDGSGLTTEVNKLTATGVYFFRIGIAEPYTYQRVTVTKLATTAPAEDATYTAEACNASDWEGRNYVNGWTWHSYVAFANATRWNGYNDKSDGLEKKVVEKLEHWFQTFDMGDGSFDIISADIPPVLVLLDRHGWEIMRKPLPKNSTYPYGDEELAALRAYDSPMVKEYKFYSQATKASGCHKYTLRMQNGKERDQIKVDGEQYTSTSLAALPPRTASGVISSGAFNDQFVTYTVKDEYEQSYRYHLDESTYSEAGSQASKYVVLGNTRYARDERSSEAKYHGAYFSKPIYEGSNPTGGNIYDMILSPTTTNVGGITVDSNKDGFVDDICLWHIQPNLNIDEEMGIKWAATSGGSGEPLTKNETLKAYKDKTGFDPYNIQLKNASDGKFFTSHITSAKLSNGSMVGDYSGAGGSLYITREAEFSSYDPSKDKGSEGYDHTNLQISNQTFMAVQDALGNMQLMPRFDHTKRINFSKTDFVTTLADPVDHDRVADLSNNESMGPQTIFFVRPQANIYHIIDNDSCEALRYRAGGEWYPIMPDSVRSPLAKDFKFYLTASYNSETKKYTIDETSEITESIIGALPDDKLYTSNIDIYVRYSYDEDNDEEKILQGRWFTAKLADKDLQSSGTIVTTEGATQGTGVSLYAGNSSTLGDANDKPATVDEDDKKWQWKFLVAPMDSSSDYYVAPDPYSVKFFNRYANYSADPSGDSNPMKIPIKVPNANSGADRFALLSHYNGGYAFAVAQEYPTYQYSYINGAGMTVPSTTAANTETEGNKIRKEANTESDYVTKCKALTSVGVYYFRIHGEAGTGTPSDRRVYRFKKVTVTTGATADPAADAGYTDVDCTRSDWEQARTEGIKVVLNNDVTHTYTYNVITNGGSDYVVDNPGSLAISAAQTNDEAVNYNFAPHLPETAQTPLLNLEDYLYYGSATKDDKGTTGDTSDDTYKVVPATKLISLEGLYDDMLYVRYNKYDVNKTTYKAPNKRNATDTGQVARHDDSKDAAININGELPYNIIWYGDNMMSAATVSETTTLSDGRSQPLSSDQYIWRFCGNDPYALTIKHKESGKYINGTSTLVAEGSAKKFMLLKKDDYDYGILQETGGTNKLSGYGQVTVSGNPTKFIIFGLSVHELIYHLVIANIGSSVEIPYSEKDENGDWKTGYRPSDNNKNTFTGTTLRDLTNTNYQLGSTVSWGNTDHTYSYNAQEVTVGDTLEVPSVFSRPNCKYFYYVDDIYTSDARTTVATVLSNKYKGLELTRLPKDDDLVGTSVVVNVAYGFDTGLETNAGEGFVTSVGQNLWYTFQTTEATPYLAQYTNAWRLQAMEGRATRYTNDYLWTPVGDVYGFKMYNRYMYKNIDNVTNVMTKTDVNAAGNLEVDTHGDNDVFELLDVPNTPGAFRVHPVANYTGTQYYLYKDAVDGNKVKLSTNYTGWTFGLGTDLLEPYIDRKGYVGGLTTAAYTANKTVLDKVKAGTATLSEIRTVQGIVYDDNNIVKYAPGYYRLHSQPGISGMSTVRYASGYLHNIEKTAVSGGIPMHLYSRAGVSTTFGGEGGLGDGFYTSAATRGDIPIAPTEYDPSTIFHFPGAAAVAPANPTSTISTQDLYVVANANGDANNGTTDTKSQRAAMAESGGISFTIMDIGGAIVLIHDGAAAGVRRYLNYDQDADIYDLKYYHNARTEESRWCMQPVQKTATAGDGEMALMITTNNGGDGYYYATFYAPFDVLLPADAEGKTYNAYIGTNWNDKGVFPVPVPACTVSATEYAAGKYVPAKTPVIIRVKDESGSVRLTLPSSTPSASSVAGNIFMGKYLEQLLAVDASHDVYTLGLPFTSEVSKDADYSSTGNLVAPLPEQATSGLGFYINATPNKEASGTQSLWTRNNRYVLHNKIYYRGSGSGAKPDLTRSADFIPVRFDDDEEPIAEKEGWMSANGDNRIYDLQGRCVVTADEVEDGSWRERLSPGIYIINGKKFCKR